MNPAMAVRTRGTRRRSSPASSSATGVVAASTMAAEHAEGALDHDVPRRPQARLRQATGRARRPAAPAPTNGRKTAKARNGHLDRAAGAAPSRGGQRAPRPRPRPAARRRGAPKAQNASRGVATTASTNSDGGGDLASGGQPVHAGCRRRGGARRCWRGRRPSSGRAGRCGGRARRAPRDAGTAPPASANVAADADERRPGRC